MRTKRSKRSNARRKVEPRRSGHVIASQSSSMGSRFHDWSIMRLKLDKENGNSCWEDAIKAEISSLTRLECFEFKPRDFVIGDDYQKMMLTMIFTVKHDLRWKAARLGAGEHLVDPLVHNLYSLTVKTISVRLLHVIAHKNNLEATLRRRHIGVHDCINQQEGVRYHGTLILVIWKDLS